MPRIACGRVGRSGVIAPEHKKTALPVAGQGGLQRTL